MMDFIEALRALKQGKKVRRTIWPIDHYIDIDKFLNERRPDASLADLFTNDWEEVE